MKSHRRLSFLVVAFLAATLLAACGQSGGHSDSRRGDVQVVLSAATTSTTTAAATTGATGTSTSTFGDGSDWGDGGMLSKLQHVNVTFSSLLARNLDGDLIDLTIDLPQTVDLIGLINGHQITLPSGTLPPGMYDQIVVVITHVEFVFLDGTQVTLTPPGGGWTRIIAVTPFEVVEGQTTTIELRFRPWQAFGEHDGEFEFSPDFDCGNGD